MERFYCMCVCDCAFRISFQHHPPSSNAWMIHTEPWQTWKLCRPSFRFGWFAALFTRQVCARALASSRPTPFWKFTILFFSFRRFQFCLLTSSIYLAFRFNAIVAYLHRLLQNVFWGISMHDCIEILDRNYLHSRSLTAPQRTWVPSNIYTFFMRKMLRWGLFCIY